MKIEKILFATSSETSSDTRPRESVGSGGKKCEKWHREKKYYRISQQFSYSPQKFNFHTCNDITKEKKTLSESSESENGRNSQFAQFSRYITRRTFSIYIYFFRLSRHCWKLFTSHSTLYFVFMHRSSTSIFPHRTENDSNWLRVESSTHKSTRNRAKKMLWKTWEIF